MPKKSMKRMHLSIRRYSENNLKPKRKILQSSKINIRKFKKYIREKWQICKRDLKKKQRRWK